MKARNLLRLTRAIARVIRQHLASDSRNGEAAPARDGTRAAARGQGTYCAPPPPRAGTNTAPWLPTHALTFTPLVTGCGDRLILLGCNRCDRHVAVDYARDGVEAEGIALAHLQAEIRGRARHVGDVEAVGRRCS